MSSTVEVVSGGFMKVSRSIEAILKFCLGNLGGSDVDMSDGSVSAPFRNFIKFG
jgi:hypothetical protein